MILSQTQIKKTNCLIASLFPTCFKNKVLLSFSFFFPFVNWRGIVVFLYFVPSSLTLKIQSMITRISLQTEETMKPARSSTHTPIPTHPLAKTLVSDCHLDSKLVKRSVQIITKILPKPSFTLIRSELCKWRQQWLNNKSFNKFGSFYWNIKRLSTHLLHFYRFISSWNSSMEANWL